MPKKLIRALVLGLAVLVMIPTVTSAAWPVMNRSSYASQRFHDGHYGLDIAAPKWTKITSIGNGKTVFAGWKRNGGGYQVWIRHRDGVTYSAYYHMAKEISYPGEYVTGDAEVIGYVGSTGYATGNHVHLEVWKGYPWRWGSRRVNPWGFVDKGTYFPYRYR
jgi:murein DD-endopeptidase MepM/ murein hydrolase activator NlpD